MKYPKNSFYNWKKFPPKTRALRGKLAREIIHDFILVSRQNNQLHSLFNGPRDTNTISFLEEEFKGLHKLFVLGMITNEDHQQALLKMTYAMLNTTQDAKTLADKIGAAWRTKILLLAKQWGCAG